MTVKFNEEGKLRWKTRGQIGMDESGGNSTKISNLIVTKNSKMVTEQILKFGLVSASIHFNFILQKCELM